MLELLAQTGARRGLTELRVSEGLNYKLNSKLCRQKSEMRKDFPKLVTVAKCLTNTPPILRNLPKTQTLQNRN